MTYKEQCALEAMKLLIPAMINNDRRSLDVSALARGAWELADFMEFERERRVTATPTPPPVL